jgi:class 3 adenylate cyclase/tetratricopeptide (TPR) repeat protein
VTACRTCGYESEGAFKFCPECGADAPAPSREQRKTVTVLFCDLTGSTSLGGTLDPERLRALLASYFEQMKAIVERHGGSVEKFIGDAVMAVFGVPVLHEDDALRAVRSAVEMREALPELGLQGRIGVMTGEVVTGTEERLATGDAVNVAARLEQAAQPGEVLIGRPTLALVRDIAEFDELEPLILKGKAEPVSAYRLLRVLDAPEQRHGTLFVGRDRELEVIRAAWDRIQAERRCELTTVIGEAGVGKSRLAAEFLASIEATVAHGRCPPYGEGITYWPVVEVVRQLDALPPDETAAEAIRTLLRESEATTSAEEIAWAFRKTLEHASAERPLVVVFDDIQWGEQTFLDLVEHVALLSSDASILLLCLARPELGEREVFVPPTLQALLAARLDQLETAERSVLQRGAVEGEIFHRGAVQALAPDEPQVTPRLAALVRKELIRPDTPLLAGEDGFRFRHILIRDAAYDALPKAARADLHERFASWLEQHGTQLVELDEILGYHLEQACGYRAELGMPDDEEMAGAAHRRLTAAGFRANRRQDYGAAVSLLERAAALLQPAEVRDLALEAELGEALVWTGRANKALQRADALTQRASAAGDRVGELCWRIQASTVGLSLELEGAMEELSALVEQALPVFHAAGDDLALYVAYAALSELEVARGRIDAGLEAYERAYAHARHAGYVPPASFGQRAFCRFAGTTPVPELLAWLDQNEAQEGRDYFFRAYRAGGLAMLGRFDEARAILTQARAELAERGVGILLANITAFESVWVELWGSDPAAAAEFGAEGFRLHEQLGDSGFLAEAAGSLAQALYALDRLDEADDWTVRSEELGLSGNAYKEMIWRRVRAKVLARRGEHADAERLALGAVAICNETDRLDAQGDVYADLAEVLLLAGRAEEAAEALEQALARYERKGNVVMAARTRDRLEALRGVP